MICILLVHLHILKGLINYLRKLKSLPAFHSAHNKAMVKDLISSSVGDVGESNTPSTIQLIKPHCGILWDFRPNVALAYLQWKSACWIVSSSLLRTWHILPIDPILSSKVTLTKMVILKHSQPNRRILDGRRVKSVSKR